MFRGYTGCMFAGGALFAGAITSNLVVMIVGVVAGLIFAGLSTGAAEWDERHERKQAAYPSYKY